MRVHEYNKIPDVKEIGKDLYSIRIPQPFYEANNIYLINGDEPALIDSGYAQNLGLLQRALRKFGLSLHKIRHIFYTHDHLDHITGALVMRSYSNAKLYGMRGMAEAVGDYTGHIQSMQRAMNRLIYKAHRDPETRNMELDRSRTGWQDFFNSVETSRKVDPILRMDVELVEGDVVSIGGREIGFLHTPGHNCWHLSPYILGEGIYFTGDLILDNISSIFAEEDGNLQHYHDSLARLSRIPIKRLLPAHGSEPESPQRKIRILQKTLALMERGVIRRLKEGPRDLSELATESMGEKIKKSSHYATALAVIHAIVQKLIAQNLVGVNEIEPPYEQYSWQGPS